MESRVRSSRADGRSGGRSGRRFRPRPRHPGPGAFVAEWWCPVCDAPAHRTSRPGRPKIYCSNACRQRAYRWRRDNGARTVLEFSQPLERARTREGLHALRRDCDFVAALRDTRGREVTVCGVLAVPARNGRFTHTRFLPYLGTCLTCSHLTTTRPDGSRVTLIEAPNVPGIVFTEVAASVPRRGDPSRWPRGAAYRLPPGMPCPAAIGVYRARQRARAEPPR